jgi:soluble lytic murein transglycosylase-like protein
MRRPLLLLLSGLTTSCLLPRAALARPATEAGSQASSGIDAFIAEAARRFALPGAWLQAIIRAESGGKPRAISAKGAMGLMQIMPATWNDLRVRHRLGADAFDPHDNVIAGAGYIRELFDRYGTPGWIAAYNAGPGRYEAALRGQPLPAETRAYVAVVAPAIGMSDGANPPAIGMVDRFAWTRSPLFFARANGSTASSAATVDQQANLSAQISPTAAKMAAPGLFVARTSRDGSQ